MNTDFKIPAHFKTGYAKRYQTVISPTYIKRLKGGNASSVSPLSIFEFAVSLILQCHYILWSRPFQAVRTKVMFSYIIVEF